MKFYPLYSYTCTPIGSTLLDSYVALRHVKKVMFVYMNDNVLFF